MTDLYKPRPDRLIRFRFSLRTVFVLLTLFGVASAWVGAQVKWIRDRHAAIERSSRINPWRDGQWRDGRWCGSRIGTAPWSIRILGETGHDIIALENFRQGDDVELKHMARELKSLFPEARLWSVGYKDFQITETWLNSRTKRRGKVHHDPRPKGTL